MANIYVIDAFPIVRLGIRALVEREGNHVLVGEADDVDSALRQIPALAVDVVILDTQRGYATMERTLPRVSRILFQDPGFHVPRVRIAVTKRGSVDSVLGAIEAVLQDEDYVRAGGTGSAAHELLSNREREILSMLLDGGRIKQIAHDLNVSAKTISTYRLRLMRKLGVENDLSLMRYAIHNGLCAT